MAEDQDDSQKTEEPTQKRLEDAKEKGNLPISKEVNNFALILIFTLVVLVWFPIVAKKSLEKLAANIIKAVKDNDISVVILDDRTINENEKVIPCAMAVGYVNQKLLKEEIRHQVSIVAVTAEVYDPHMAAVLIAFGCTAIYPYMMYASTVSFFQKQKQRFRR